MTRKKFVKAVSLVIAWAIFLFLVITNWNDLSSVQWQGVRDIAKIGGIMEFVEWYGGYILLFSLIIGFLFVCFRRIRKDQVRATRSTGEDDQECDEFIIAVDRDCDPAYSSLGGNIHHKSAFDKDLEWKNLDP